MLEIAEELLAMTKINWESWDSMSKVEKIEYMKTRYFYPYTSTMQNIFQAASNAIRDGKVDTDQALRYLSFIEFIVDNYNDSLGPKGYEEIIELFYPPVRSRFERSEQKSTEEVIKGSIVEVLFPGMRFPHKNKLVGNNKAIVVVNPD